MGATSTTQQKLSKIQNHFEQEGYVILRKLLANTKEAMTDKDGILVSNDPDKILLEQWHDYYNEFFSTVFEKLYDNGYTDFPQHNRWTSTSTVEYAMEEGRERGFQEIVMRSPGRYEISLMHNNTTLMNRPSIRPLLQKLVPIMTHLVRDVKDARDLNLIYSLIVSTPTDEAHSQAQLWHADGEHVDLSVHQRAHCINIFLPLVNVTYDMGPTEFFPQSHYATRQASSPMRFSKQDLPHEPLAPLLQVGDALVFDYRLLHRGLPNISNLPSSNATTSTAPTSVPRNRPMLVLTFSSPWFHDVKNWPNRSIDEVRNKQHTGVPDRQVS